MSSEACSSRASTSHGSRYESNSAKRWSMSCQRADSRRRRKDSVKHNSETKHNRKVKRNPVVADERLDVEDFVTIIKSYGIKRKVDKVADPKYNNKIIETIRKNNVEHNTTLPTKPNVRISTEEPYKDVCVSPRRFEKILTYYEIMYDLFDESKITLSQIKELELWFFNLVEPPADCGKNRRMQRWRQRELSKCERYLSPYFPRTAKSFSSKIQQYVKENLPGDYEKVHRKKIDKLCKKMETGCFVESKKKPSRVRLNLDNQQEGKKTLVNLSKIGIRKR